MPRTATAPRGVQAREARQSLSESASLLFVALVVSVILSSPINANPNDFSGAWSGTWSSFDPGYVGSVTIDMAQTGNTLSGTMSLTNTDCGNLYNLPLSGSAVGNQANFSTSTSCGGSFATLEYTDGTLSNNTVSGEYNVFDNGAYYDGGTFNVQRSVNLITATAESGGSIAPSGVQQITAGTDASFTITPNSGYKVSDVVVDDGSVGPRTSYTFTNVAANHVIAASFESIPEYTVTSSAGSGGSIQPAGTTTVQEGDDLAFTITPGSGYRILDVLADGLSVGAVGTWTFSDIDNAHTITASFQAIQTITASAGPGGSISPSGALEVDQGTSQTFTISPETGFVVADVLVDGVSVGAVKSFVMEDIQVDRSIAASFRRAIVPILPALDLLIE